MTDIDRRVRAAIQVLADAEFVNTPPVVTMHERTSPTTAPRRPRVLVAALAVAALALIATAVSAAGVLPASVTSAFHHISSWGKTCRVDSSSAERLASYRAPDGRVFEWWRAVGPNRADGSFVSGDDFRIVSRTGKPHDQAWACQTIAYPPEKLVVGGMGDSPVGDVIWGQAPEGTTAAVRAVRRDGTTVEIPLQHGRYFMAATNAPTDRGSFVSIEALDATGAVIATERNPLAP